MALQSSGPISIGNINTEFGFAATTPRSLGQLYRNGGIVGAGAPNVPISGAISLSQFYGAANLFNYVISSNQTNLNLRDGAIAAGWDGVRPLAVTINSGVYISSNSVSTPALTVNGAFAGGVSLTNNGFIVGRGGNGGAGGSTSGAAGLSGGAALSVSSAISISNSGTIAGGGGGGGGGGSNDNGGPYGGGGGGGGRSSLTSSTGGAPGPNGLQQSRAPQAGGAGTSVSAGGGGLGSLFPNASGGGGDGGAGGGWGAAGSTGGSGFGVGTKYAGGSGGSGGSAVAGNSNITWVATGTRLGAIA